MPTRNELTPLPPPAPEVNSLPDSTVAPVPDLKSQNNTVVATSKESDEDIDTFIRTIMNEQYFLKAHLFDLHLDKSGKLKFEISLCGAVKLTSFDDKDASHIMQYFQSGF